MAAAIILGGAALWLWFRVHTGIVLEDALITFRYARNLAEGRGFVFNEGERVLGTTTPLLTLALGLLGAVFGAERIPVIANVLMMPAAAGAGLFTFAALRALGRPEPLALAVMAAFCFHGDTIWTACGGMETPLVLLFMGASLYALARQAHRLAAVAAALLILTRIDGLIWAIGVFLVIAIQARRSLPGAVLTGAAVVAPWALFSFGYFGTIVPHSVVAKRVIGASAGGEFWPHIIGFARWSSEYLSSSWPAGGPIGLAFFAVGAWTVLGSPKRGPLALVLAFSFAFPLALCLGGSPSFPWYLVPMGYTALIIGCLGIWRLGEITSAAGRRSAAAGWGARGILAALCLVYAWTLAGRASAEATFWRRNQINEDGARKAAGEWLARNTPPDALVAMEAVGYQAYYSGRKVIDLAGLVSPAVVALRRESGTNAETFFRVLRDLKPDYLLLRTFEVSTNRHYHGGKLFESTEQMDYFTRHYVEAQRFAAPLERVWGEKAYLTIYRRLTTEDRPPPPHS